MEKARDIQIEYINALSVKLGKVVNTTNLTIEEASLIIKKLRQEVKDRYKGI